MPFRPNDSISRSCFVREGRFLARTLHFDKRTILRRDQIEIDRGRLVFLVIEIEQGDAVDHTDTDRRDEFLDRRLADLFLRSPVAGKPPRQPGSLR